MSRATSIIFLDETHPIDALELIAHEENWEFSRDYDNEITVSIDGGWKKYTVTASWNASRNLFKTICTTSYNIFLCNSIFRGPIPFITLCI